MANWEVRRIHVDQGSSTDIMFVDLLKKFRIAEEDLTTYKGIDLSGFNGSRTRPLGFIKMMVTYGDESLSRVVKTKFLFLP